MSVGSRKAVRCGLGFNIKALAYCGAEPQALKNLEKCEKVDYIKHKSPSKKGYNMISDIIKEKDGFSMLNDQIAICRGDCLHKLAAITDNSVDCVITDPPYFINNMGNNWNVAALNKSAEKASIIGSLPVGMKFDPQQGKDLQIFMTKVSTEVYRILKPGGFYISFSQGRLYHRMAVAIEDCGFEIRDMLVWKREGQAKAFSQNHFVRKMKMTEKEKENLIKSLGGRKTPQLKGQSEPMVLAQKPKDGTFINNWVKYQVGLIDTTASLDGKFPGTVMEVEKPKGKERQESDHMTMKPVALMEHLIKIFSCEGAVICDPFLGSGSTGVACINTNRQFIGIELDDGYYQQSENRLISHLPKNKK